MRRSVLYPSLVLLAGAVVAFAAMPIDSTSLAGDVSLRRSPNSTELAGLLTAGTPITIVERRDGWVRARVEGWIPETAVGTATAPQAALPAPQATLSAPQAALPSIHGGATVEGAIRLKFGNWRNKRTAAGTSLFLIPSRQIEDWERESQTEPSAARLKALDTEAARLKDDADRAMREDAFTAAVVRRDELMARREKLLDERLEILAAIHGRHEARARTGALAQTTADAKGWFSFENVSPGAYTIYARVVGDDLDVEWIEALDVAQDTVRIDLAAESARGLLAKMQE